MALTARLRPAAGEPEGALVLFHGRGADENDLFPLLDALDPERRFVGATPRGPLSLPPIAIGHGTLDPVIGVEWGREARRMLEAAGAEVLYRETPMYHQLDPEFVLEVSEWIRRIIPPRG